MEIKIVEKILAANEALAEENRNLLSSHGVFAVNLMGPPGAGKTALLEATLEAVGGAVRPAVVEGDVSTTADAERLCRFGIPIVQVNTDRFGGECHLEARMIKSALAEIPLFAIDLLFIENIGNLICPAEFDLGQHTNVVLLDITGGSDKPLKYPLMFHISQALLINKVDLLENAPAEVSVLTQNALRANGALACFPLSAKTGEGLEAWVEWLLHRLRMQLAARSAAPRRGEPGGLTPLPPSGAHLLLTSDLSAQFGRARGPSPTGHVRALVLHSVPHSPGR